MAEQSFVGDAAPATCGSVAEPAVVAPSSTPGRRDDAARWLTVALFAVGFCWLFRRWFLSGFDAVFGDEEDGYLAIALVEHWHHVFTGAAHWGDPIIFYPTRGTLGYTDAFFLIGVVHALLRGLGLDAFTAYMTAIAGLTAAGFFGFRRLAVRHFGVPPAYAAVGAFLFAFANVDAVKLIHVQAYGAMLLPWLCDLALSGWASKRAGAVFGGAAGLFYGALFLTAFQTAWFFGCYLLLLALLHPVVCGLATTRDLARRMLTEHRSLMVAAACGFAIGIVPFLLLYVPVFLAGHSRDFAEVASNMPQWRDLANVTPENAVWGGLLEWLTLAGRPDRPVWEAELAFTPAVLAVFVIGLAALVARRGRPSWKHDQVFVLLGAAVVIVWLLQMDYFGLRPWRAVWATVPGAKAIRYVFRSQLVANLFVTLVVARVLADMAVARVLTVFICAFLIIEQVNLTWPPILSRRAALAWIEAAPPPPQGCRAFYVTPNAIPLDGSGPRHQDDAMLFAEIRGIPTVNGFSSWFPDGWALDEPANPGYAAAVRDWARRNGLEQGLCGLDPRGATWTPGLPP
jgi:hypothetical protein